ncbi:MAG: hypothetical protein WC054_00625 [Candidatus Nanopelagicales bacterium]
MKLFLMWVFLPPLLAFPSAWFWTVVLGFVHLNALPALNPIGWATLWPICVFVGYAYFTSTVVASFAKEYFSD